MSRQDWQEWVAMYKRWMCVRHSPTIDEMLEEWRKAFEKIGASAEELADATLWLFEDPERANEFPKPHFAHLRHWILSRREARAKVARLLQRRDHDALEEKRTKGWQNEEVKKKILNAIGRKVDDEDA